MQLQRASDRQIPVTLTEFRRASPTSSLEPEAICVVLLMYDSKVNRTIPTTLFVSLHHLSCRVMSFYSL